MSAKRGPRQAPGWAEGACVWATVAFAAWATQPVTWQVALLGAAASVVLGLLLERASGDD